ncbi:OsmC family protein [bacterium]|nr:OsmC family protein [bacterium]
MADMEIYFPKGKRVDVQYDGFVIKTDQSVKHGGEASAPAPFDLFLASIGACSGVYVLSFCQKRDIPTDKIKLRLSTQYNEQKKLLDEITITIELPPDFPEKYVQPIMRSAEMCTVSKHLYDPPAIKLETVIGA